MAFYEIEPFGDGRADIRSGIIASTIANVHRKKSRAAYKTKDFLPKFKSRRAQPVDVSEKVVAMFMKIDKQQKAN